MAARPTAESKTAAAVPTTEEGGFAASIHVPCNDCTACMQEMRQHIESLRPAVEELARMETEAQGNFLRFQTQWLPKHTA